MARVLFCWELGNGLAYMEAITLVARAVAKAGHEVHFAARDLTHAERLLGDQIPFYQAPTHVTPRRMLLPRPMTYTDMLINLGYGNPVPVVGRVRAWRNLLTRLRPDVVHCANAPGALLAARGTGIRSRAAGIGFLVPPSQSPLPSLRTWGPQADSQRMAAREQLVLDGMNRALEAINAPKLVSVGALYGEADVRVLYSYPELDDYAPRGDVTYVGVLQPATGAAPVWPDTPGKRIFAYLDPGESVPMLLKALASTGQPVLAYLPHPPEELVKHYASGNLRLTDRPLDLAKTAALCDVGVSHGGHNIVGSFLAAGKPQLVLPNMFPERITGGKITGHGVGLLSRWGEVDFSEKLRKLLQEAGFSEQAKTVAARLVHFDMHYAFKEAVTSVDALAKVGPRNWR